MGKISVPVYNDYCPQTLFLYGTYDENGNADFGLFCWFSYTYDGQMGVMCCIGGEKGTKANIHRTGIFSASIVTEALLPSADYLGNNKGFDPGKVDFTLGKGAVLDVPVVEESPVVFELEVKQFIPLDGGEVMLCNIRNVLQDESLASTDETVADKLARIAPVKTTCHSYFGFKGDYKGAWGEPMKELSTSSSNR